MGQDGVVTCQQGQLLILDKGRKVAAVVACVDGNMGLVEGRPQLEVPKFHEYKKMVDEGRISVVEAVEELGISRSKWYSMARKNGGIRK